MFRKKFSSFLSSEYGFDGSQVSDVRSVNSMSTVAPIWSRELVLVSGKGGVGKTTLTAVLGRMASEAGRKVLVAEVTPDLHTTSPLLSHFGHPRPRSEEPFRISGQLYGIRIAPQSGHRLFLREALKVRLLVDAAMKSAALTRFLMAAPTFPEIGVLFQIVHLIRQRKFDHIIIDLPATGHALALASLPRVVHRIVPTGLIGDAIKEGLDILTSASRCWAVIPTLPESMPVTETGELIESLKECDINIGAVVLNRVPANPLTAQERAKLDRWTLEHPKTRFLGARELVRLDRALSAQEMFRSVLPETLTKYEVPELHASRDQERLSRFPDHLRQPIASPSSQRSEPFSNETNADGGQA